jgi:hypothetical protein
MLMFFSYSPVANYWGFSIEPFKIVVFRASPVIYTFKVVCSSIIDVSAPWKVYTYYEVSVIEIAELCKAQ